jgi:hypothetical protein
MMFENISENILRPTKPLNVIFVSFVREKIPIFLIFFSVDKDVIFEASLPKAKKKLKIK